MKVVVRDDIIKVESFLDAAVKFRKYLEVIAGCGGYCFLEQFERIWDKEGGNYLARRMEDANFIKTDYFSRYKFVRLTSTALKYLRYRDDERDFSGVPKNTISVRNLKSKPSEKVLFSSAIYFELYHRNMPYFSKDYHMELLEIQLNKDYSEKIKKEEKIIETTTENLEYLTYAKRTIVDDLFKAEKSNEELLSGLIESFEEEGSILESKKNLLNKNTCEIERVKKWQQETTAILKSSSYVSNMMGKIKNALNEFTDEINESKKKIANFKRAQDISDKKKNVIIKKFMEHRDISKIICIYDKETMKLTVVSTFVKYNRGKYLKFLWELFSLLYDNGFFVKTVELILESVYSVGDTNRNAIKKEIIPYRKKEIEYHLNYDMDVFDESIPRDKDYIDWREESLRQLVYNDVEFNVKFNTLGELQKYFDSISDSVGYLKKGHLEQFEELKNKLTINKPLKNPF